MGNNPFFLFYLKKFSSFNLIKAAANNLLLYTYDDYLEASNCAYQLLPTGEIKERERNFTKGDFSHFDLEGYELVDSQLLFSPSRLTAKLDGKGISFSKSCREFLDSDFVEVLYEPHENLLAVRGCEDNHPNALKWSSVKEGRIHMALRSALGINGLLYEVNGWNRDFRIALSGEPKSRAGEAVIFFDLALAEPIALIPMEDGRYRRVSLYSMNLIEHFGEEFYQSRFSNRYYLMSIFKRWNLGAGLEDTEGKVNGFLKEIREASDDA